MFTLKGVNLYHCYFHNGENLTRHLKAHIINLIIRATTVSERDRISLLILSLFCSLVMRGHQQQTNVLFSSDNKCNLHNRLVLVEFQSTYSLLFKAV